MKRLVYFLIIAGALGFFGYRYWQSNRPQVEAFIQPVVEAVKNTVAQKPAPMPTPEPGAPLPATPGGPRLAPPGVFYVLERVKKTTDTGVIAIVPGEEVRLMQRLPKDRLRVTTGRHDFEVKASQVTQDYDVAQAARQGRAPAATLRRGPRQ